MKPAFNYFYNKETAQANTHTGSCTMGLGGGSMECVDWPSSNGSDVILPVLNSSSLLGGRSNIPGLSSMKLNFSLCLFPLCRSL